MEKIQLFVFPYFNIFVCVLCGIVIAGVGYFSVKRQIKDTQLMFFFTRFCIVFVVMFLVVDLLLHPLYTNVLSDGNQIEKDAISIAHYVENEEPTKLYFVVSPSNRYERAAYAYFLQELLFISEEELATMELTDAYFITDRECVPGANFVEIALGTESLKLYRQR